MASWFHYKDGWHFSRNPDGSVAVGRSEPGKGDGVETILTIDPDSWASIVSEVSAAPGSGVAHAIARALHMAGA